MGQDPSEPPPLSAGATPPAAAHRVADELLRRFALGPPLHLEVAPGGLLNQNLFARTALGAYFLKGYRYADPEPIRREHALIRFAVAAGLPALAPLATPAGETLLRIGGRWWAVYPRLESAQLSTGALTAQAAGSLGDALGRVHATLAAFPARDSDRFPPWLGWDSARVYAEMAEYEAIIRRRPALDPFDQHALSSFGYRRTLLAGAVPPAASFAQLPTQLLHGDFHLGNLFWTPAGEVEWIADWELARVGPRAWEVVRALDLSLGLERELDTEGAALTAFIHGYAAAAPLSAEECEAMPDFYWASRVHSLWVYEEHYRKGAAKSDRLAMQDLELLHWLAANRLRVAAALREALSTAPPRSLA